VENKIFKFLLAIIISLFFVQNTLNAQQTLWENISQNYFISSIENTPWGIIIGENDGRVWLKPFNGLYISYDNGITFKEFGLKDKGITNIFYENNNIYATTYYHTNTPAGLFISTNTGESFEHIGPAYSSNFVKIIDEIIYLGTYAHGLFISYDHGNNFEQKIPNIYVKNITKSENKITAFGLSNTFTSYDNGINWNQEPYIDYISNLNNFRFKNINVHTTINDVYVNDIKTNLNKFSSDLQYYFENNEYYLLSVVEGYGLYKYKIPKKLTYKEPIFRIPWEYFKQDELIDKITAYFDHQYPLLGKNIFEEPAYNKSTLNFLGINELPPKMYYSSHNGVDFALPYGQKIFATANGNARYFWCDDCGHSIEIDHLNGYKSIYMHLQDEIEISKKQITQVFEGKYLGKVGLSGKTTGSHLHFSVKKDDIVIDPFGWQDIYNQDPWEHYLKNNIVGSKSVYLWKNNLESPKEILNENGFVKVQKDNKVVLLNTNEKEQIINVDITNYINPTLKVNTNYKHLSGLNYIENTSTLISLLSTFGDKIYEIKNSIKIGFYISKEILDKNISIWHFDNINGIWEILPTFKDYQSGFIYTFTNKFSHFAVFDNLYVNKNNFSDKIIIRQNSFLIDLQ